MKEIKLLIAALYPISLLVLLVVELYFIQTHSVLSISDFIYWWILIGWVYMVVAFRLKPEYSLIPSFVLFILSALTASFGLSLVGETLMRTSFIGWIVSIVQALFDYKKQPVRK